MTDGDVDTNEMFEDRPELEAFARDLRQAAAGAPAPRVDAALAAVLDGSMAPAPSDTTVPVGGRLRRRPRLEARTRLRLVLAGGVAAAVVLVAAIGGGLPQPAQRNVARLADRVGLELPDGEAGTGVDADAGSEADRLPTTPPSAPPAGVPTTTSSTVTPAVVPESVADADAVDELPDTPVAPPEDTPGRGDPPADGDVGRDDEPRDDRRPDGAKGRTP